MKKILAVILFCLAFSAPALHAQTHSVALTWSASPTSGIAGYNVYRASFNGTLGTFAKLTSSPTTSLNYSDTAVAAGQVWVYYVTSTCPVTGGCSPGVAGESAPSNQVTVTIPSDTPLPPVNLTGTPQ